MIKSYGICLQRPESPCEQHFLGSNPAPPPIVATLQPGTQQALHCAALSSPTTSKELTWCVPVGWPEGSAQDGGGSGLYTHVCIYLLILHKDICSSLSLFVSSPYTSVSFKDNAL